MTQYVVDTSAYARRHQAAVAARLKPLLDDAKLATCRVLDMEILFSARSGDEHRQVRLDRALELRALPLDPTVFDRAVEIQGMLADRGKHRGVSVVDLVVAACAEVAHHTVLHYDAHFERIAEITGQPVEWVVPRGTAD